MIRHVLTSLNERAKELSCLYELDEVLKNAYWPLDKIFGAVLAVIPKGWQHTTLCEVRIAHLGRVYQSVDFERTPWMISAALRVDDQEEGIIEVAYTQLVETDGRLVFLPNEQKLLEAIADRLGHYLFSRRLRHTLQIMRAVPEPSLVWPQEEGESEEPDTPSLWRKRMAQLLASCLETGRFGVLAVYLIGSARDKSARDASDIDLLIHTEGTPDQLILLRHWLEGWSLCLAALNFHRCGIKIEGGIIDAHFLNNEDILMKSSFAVMIPHQAERLDLRTEPD